MLRQPLEEGQDEDDAFQYQEIVDWNDAPHSTLTDVIDVFDTVKDLERQQALSLQRLSQA